MNAKVCQFPRNNENEKDKKVSNTVKIDRKKSFRRVDKGLTEVLEKQKRELTAELEKQKKELATVRESIKEIEFWNTAKEVCGSFIRLASRDITNVQYRIAVSVLLRTIYNNRMSDLMPYSSFIKGAYSQETGKLECGGIPCNRNTIAKALTALADRGFIKLHAVGKLKTTHITVNLLALQTYVECRELEIDPNFCDDEEFFTND